jgi:hypothetical protein
VRKAGRYFRAGAAITGLALTMAMFFLFAHSILGAAAQGREKTDGLVVSIRDGKFERFQQNLWNPLRVGQKVSQGDRVRTDTTAVAIVTLADIGRIVIGPSSDIELGKDPKDFKIKMQRGFAWFESNLPKGSKASITTSLATAGIRGTRFCVCYDGKNYCASTCSGEIEVSLDGGRVIKVPRGEYFAFTAGSPIPTKTAPAASLLEKTGAGFDFCFNCHVVGGRGKLKQDGK